MSSRKNPSHPQKQVSKQRINSARLAPQSEAEGYFESKLNNHLMNLSKPLKEIVQQNSARAYNSSKDSYDTEPIRLPREEA